MYLCNLLWCKFCRVLIRQLKLLQAISDVQKEIDENRGDIALIRGRGKEVSEDSLTLPDKEAEDLFRKLWGANGDVLSLLYAGTRALKRDVTRLGKRTNQGAFDDGVNSAKRYFINNYQDEERQRGIDIVLGFVSGDGMQNTVRNLPVNYDIASGKTLQLDYVVSKEEVTVGDLETQFSKISSSLESLEVHDSEDLMEYDVEQGLPLVSQGPSGIHSGHLNAMHRDSDSDDIDSAVYGGIVDDGSASDSSGNYGGNRNDYDGMNDDGDSSRVMENDIGSVKMKGMKVSRDDDEDNDEDDDDDDDEDTGDNSNESDGNKRDYYNIAAPEDVLDISDIEGYLKDRRNKLDAIFKNLLNDLEDSPKNTDSTNLTPKSPGNRKNKPFKNRIKIKRTHLRYPDNYKKTRIPKTERKVFKELEKDEKDHDLPLQSSNTLLLKNLHKYRKILITLLFGLMIHYSIIWGIKII
jgi:hypothetical protein